MLTVKMKKKTEQRVLGRNPWVFASEIEKSPELDAAEPGALGELQSDSGRFIGYGYYNKNSIISFRIFTWEKEVKIDGGFIAGRIWNAMEMRDKIFSEPHYRMVHSEADGLPGLTIDRFDKSFVCQISTAGMERFKDDIIKTLTKIGAENILFRNDVPTRDKEGVPQYVSIAQGDIPPLTEVMEHGAIFLADLQNGQKTGWFYDQRQNRKLVAGFAKDKTMLDVYCHSGGFGIQAAKNGAKAVTFMDSSAPALEIAKKAVECNKITAKCEFIEDKAYDGLAKLASAGKKFEVIVADPPAFVKSKKDVSAGLMGYEKLAGLCAKLLTKGGVLFIASCSHHAEREQFIKSVARGIYKAGRGVRILFITGADSDHPIHPMLPESEYLKGILIEVS